MVDARRPDRLADSRHLAKWHAPWRVLGAADDDRKRLQIGHHLSRLWREPNRHVARLARGIDPIAHVDPGERRPQRLGDLTDGHADGAGEPPIELHVELRLLSFRRETHVHRARHLLHLRDDLVGEPSQHPGIGTLQLQLDLLLPFVEAGADRGRNPGQR